MADKIKDLEKIIKYSFRNKSLILRSLTHKSFNNEKNNENTDIEKMTPEGVEGYVNYKGDLHGILEQMKGGIRSGLSYCGVNSIYNLHKKEIQFLKISGSSKDESNSHDIKEI